MLDALTLRVAFGVLVLVLLLLFSLITYRTTRSAFSFWWSSALALFLLGSAAYLLDGSPQQVWANPLGNGLTVAGSAGVWAGSRSLRGRTTPLGLLAAGPLLVIVVSSLDSPATNDWSGGPVFLALMSALIGLSAREILLLDPSYSRSRWPLLIGSAALSAYYLVRTVAFLAVGPRGEVFTQYFGTPSTTLITMALLVVVSFSMASLSGEQVARALTAGAARNEDELAEAAAVQKRLLPLHVPDLPGYEIAGGCVPGGTVSGDFFDWQRTPEGLAITVADVMGKGVGAAMLAATVRAALRVATPLHEPEDTVAVVDRVVEPDLAVNEAFVTMLHLRLEEATGRMSFVDAGHGLGLVLRTNGRHEPMRSDHLPLGVEGYEERRAGTATLGVGDLVLIFSDGVLDLFDGTLDSIDRAADAVRAGGPSAPEAVASITRLVADSPVPDDVTVVALRRVA